MGRRSVFAGAALAVALASPPAIAAPLANVYVDGPALRATVDSGQVAIQPVGDYRLRGRAGDEPLTNPHQGYSIHDILAQAGASAAAVDVLGNNGLFFTLSGHQLDQPTDVFENDLLPIVWLNVDGSGSMRPLFKDDPNDVNAGTDLQAAPVSIYAHTAGHIDLAAREVTSDAVSGQPVQFEADAQACTGGADPTVTWNFGDGTGGSGARPTHTYTGHGRFSGSAVADCGDGNGAAVAVKVDVGGLGAGPTPGPGGGTPTPSPGPTATPTPARTPKPRSTRTPTPAKGGSGGGHKGGSSNGTPAATATATATAAPTFAATATPFSTPAATPTPVPTASGSPTPTATASPTVTPTAAPTDNLPVVSGKLVSAVVPITAQQFAAAEADAARQSAGAAPKSPPSVALPLGLLVLGALLFAGAWREQRGPRR